jgi:low affinity Fe/Cu permease
MRDAFTKLAQRTSSVVGSAGAFVIAVLMVVVWAAAGPIFHFSNTWQLVINTATTVLTFLIVFLIQNSQNRDSRAIQLKLDELLRAIDSARTGLVNIEERSDRDLDAMKKEFERLADESEGADAIEPIGQASEDRS